MARFAQTATNGAQIEISTGNYYLDLNPAQFGRQIMSNAASLNLGTNGNDTISLSGAKHIAYGGDGNDLINGTTTTDWLVGGAGSDTINSNGGKDIIFGGQGNDAINGGAGTDTVMYEFLDQVGVGNKLITITKTGNMAFTVNAGSFEGTDTIVNVEQLMIMNPYDIGLQGDYYIDLTKLNNKAIGYEFSVSVIDKPGFEEGVQASIVGVMKATALAGTFVDLGTA